MKVTPSSDIFSYLLSFMFCKLQQGHWLVYNFSFVNNIGTLWMFLCHMCFSVCRKIPRDLTEASLSGAGLSIVAAVFMVFLFGMVDSFNTLPDYYGLERYNKVFMGFLILRIYPVLCRYQSY